MMASKQALAAAFAVMMIATFAILGVVWFFTAFRRKSQGDVAGPSEREKDIVALALSVIHLAAFVVLAILNLQPAMVLAAFFVSVVYYQAMYAPELLFDGGARPRKRAGFRFGLPSLRFLKRKAPEPEMPHLRLRQDESRPPGSPPPSLHDFPDEFDQLMEEELEKGIDSPLPFENSDIDYLQAEETVIETGRPRESSFDSTVSIPKASPAIHELREDEAIFMAVPPLEIPISDEPASAPSTHMMVDFDDAEDSEGADLFPSAPVAGPVPELAKSDSVTGMFHPLDTGEIDALSMSPRNSLQIFDSFPSLNLELPAFGTEYFFHPSESFRRRTPIHPMEGVPVSDSAIHRVDHSLMESLRGAIEQKKVPSPRRTAKGGPLDPGELYSTTSPDETPSTPGIESGNDSPAKEE